MSTRAIASAIGMACAALGTAHAAADPPGCSAIRSAVDRSLAWRAVSSGLELARIDIKSEHIDNLTLVRYSSVAYRTRPFDLRDIAALNQRNGFYAPPLFSIKEMQRNFRQATLIASAGLTRSYSEPLPAGFLRIDGMTRAPVAPRDRILDGVVCIAENGRVTILSELDAGSRRAPRNVDGCYAGFQAGPVLVADGAVAAHEHALKTARVTLGIGSPDSVVIAYSGSATTAAIGCGITSSRIGVNHAIGLQGDTLGGVALGANLAPDGTGSALGNTEATIASVLIVEPRSVPKALAATSHRR